MQCRLLTRGVAAKRNTTPGQFHQFNFEVQTSASKTTLLPLPARTHQVTQSVRLFHDLPVQQSAHFALKMQTQLKIAQISQLQRQPAAWRQCQHTWRVRSAAGSAAPPTVLDQSSGGQQAKEGQQNSIIETV